MNVKLVININGLIFGCLFKSVREIKFIVVYVYK